MPNPADIMKLMGMKNKFTQSHPKFVQFISDVARRGGNVGDIIEVSIISPEGTRTTANLKVTEDDVAMVNEIKTMR